MNYNVAVRKFTRPMGLNWGKGCRQRLKAAKNSVNTAYATSGAMLTTAIVAGSQQNMWAASLLTLGSLFGLKLAKFQKGLAKDIANSFEYRLLSSRAEKILGKKL